MENIDVKSTRIVEESYRRLCTSVIRYIYYKIGNKEEAEDLVQDTFVRLMEYKQMLCEETVQSFIFTIARNLVTDYLRRYYKRREINVYLLETTVTYNNNVESRIVADDLARREKHRMSLLSPQRRVIYRMNRYEEKTVPEIALKLQLSLRTVENHLFAGRKEVREYMRQCI